MSAISAVEPLLPYGRAERVLVLGRGGPGELVPGAAARTEDDADLVLLLPERRELRRRSWLREAAARAAGAVRPEGMVYAVVPRGHRRRARAELTGAGLLVESAFAHLRDAGVVRYLMPLERRVLDYAFDRLIGARPRTRSALRVLVKLPSAVRLLAFALPGVGLAARRPGGRPFADWIGGTVAGSPQPDDVVVGTSWRGQSGSVTLHCFAARSTAPWGVAKIIPSGDDEGLVLGRLRGAADLSGARVPEPLRRLRIGDWAAVVETHVSGQPAAVVLARSPRRLAALLEELAGWLARWGLMTAFPTVLDRTLLEERVLRPAALLRSLLPSGTGYPEWVRSRCEALTGANVPLLAAHNDLTMWNVVVNEGSPPGVLDWETAEPAGLPMVDFFYSMTDAVAASEGYTSRLRALQACFVAGGPRAELVSQLRARVANAVGVEQPIAELAFHACWLQHAANERAAGGGGTEFAEIVKWLAGDREQIRT